jgi:hypothetical protein
MTIFQSFRSTVNGWVRGDRADSYHVLEDPITGAPVGLQSKRGNGAQGIWTPIDLTAGQIASPTAEMIADLNAVFRLNVAPYTRYRSNGTTMVESVSGSVAGSLTVGGALIIATATPASASAAGVAGTIAWDAGFIYVCTATNTWCRVAIATW